MPGTVYALLVGINDYQGALKSLKGCVEDVTQLAAILEARLAPGQFKPNFLLDRDATRDNVIAAFAAHLGQAKDGDVALFAYSGHGSRERVQPEFRYLEPDGWNQTLVLADSRLPDSTDLADKELRALLNRVAGGADDPHVVVILDCCYSGGGTREPMVGEVSLRQAPAVKDARPLESYLAEVQNAVRSDADSGGDHEHPTGPVASLPHPKHIALEACERHQTAKEILVDGKHRGAFSLALQHALTSLPNGATYRDLLRTAQNQVVNLVSGQTPLATDEGESLDQPFLGGAIQPRPATITLEFQHGSWWIDAGVMHGLQPTRGDRTTRLAVRELANPEGEALGHVRVVEAGTTRSRVALDGLALTEDCLYAAVVVGVPEPLLGVEVRADVRIANPSAVNQLRAAIAASPLLREVTSGQPGPGQTLLVLLGEDLMVARADGTALTDGCTGTEHGVNRTIKRLEHLARWYQIKSMENPTSRLAGKAAVELLEANLGETPQDAQGRPALQPGPDGIIRLAYQEVDGKPTAPLIFIRIRNQSDRKLYCTLLDLTDRFACSSTLLPNDSIPARATAWANAGRPIPASIPSERFKPGSTPSAQDWLKLVAAEVRFEPDAFTLPKLDGVRSRSANRARPPEKHVQDDPLDEDEASGPAYGKDWTTTTLTLLTQPPPHVPKPQSGPPATGPGTGTAATKTKEP